MVNPLRRGTDTAEPFVRAARIIERGRNLRPDGMYDGACDVLYCPEYADLSEAAWARRRQFRAIFVEPAGFYLATDVMPIDEAQEWRILALCFMAAMVEAGDA